MKKVLKCLSIIISIGVVIGLILAFFCKNKEDDDFFESDLEDEDFDLDSDLQAVEREYVPLKKSVPEETPAEEPAEEKKDPSI